MNREMVVPIASTIVEEVMDLIRSYKNQKDRLRFLDYVISALNEERDSVTDSTDDD